MEEIFGDELNRSEIKIPTGNKVNEIGIEEIANTLGNLLVWFASTEAVLTDLEWDFLGR